MTVARRRGRRGRVVVRVVVGLVLLLLLVRVVPALRSAVEAPLFLGNLAVQRPEARPLRFFTRVPQRQEVRYALANGTPVSADLYLPRGRRPVPALVIFTPLIAEGRADPRLVNLGDTLARLGILSLVPDRVGEAGALDPGDVEEVVAAFRFLAAHPRARRERLGLWGISYGAGPAFVAATDPQVRDAVDVLVSLGGYHDVRSTLRFVLSPAAHPWARETAERNLLRLLPVDLREQAEAIFARHDGLPPADIEQVLALAGARLGHIADALSPAARTEQLAALPVTVFIAHALGDPYVPATESQALARVFPTERVHFTFLDFLEHASPRPLTWGNLWRYYLPSLRDALRLVYRFLLVRY